MPRLCRFKAALTVFVVEKKYAVASNPADGWPNPCTVQEQRLHRCFAMEPLTAVTATADGTYVFAGGASGSGYAWETASGKLLRIWPAHYKVIHDGDSYLISKEHRSALCAQLPDFQT